MNPQHCITQGAVDIKSQLTRQCLHGCQVLTDRSHALRGNAASDALRPALRKGDAERHRMHSHAERGNDQLAENYQHHLQMMGGSCVRACKTENHQQVSVDPKVSRTQPP